MSSRDQDYTTGLTPVGMPFSAESQLIQAQANEIERLRKACDDFDTENAKLMNECSALKKKREEAVRLLTRWMNRKVPTIELEDGRLMLDLTSDERRLGLETHDFLASHDVSDTPRAQR